MMDILGDFENCTARTLAQIKRVLGAKSEKDSEVSRNGRPSRSVRPPRSTESTGNGRTTRSKRILTDVPPAALNPSPLKNSHNKDDHAKFDLCIQITSSTMKILDSWKTKKPLASLRANVYEACSIALQFLDESKDLARLNDFDFEKRRSNFALKLMECEMISESLAQLEILGLILAGISTKSRNTNREVSHESTSILSILCMPPPTSSNIDHTILVVTCQIILIKCLLKSSKSSKVSEIKQKSMFKALLDGLSSPVGIHFWCSRLGEPRATQHLGMICRLILTISSSIPASEAFILRSECIKTLPFLDPKHIDLLVSSFHQLLRLESNCEKRVVELYGDRILSICDLKRDFLSDNSSFSKLCQECNQIVKSDYNAQEKWRKALNSLITNTDHQDVYQELDLLRNAAEINHNALINLLQKPEVLALATHQPAFFTYLLSFVQDILDNFPRQKPFGVLTALIEFFCTLKKNQTTCLPKPVTASITKSADYIFKFVKNNITGIPASDMVSLLTVYEGLVILIENDDIKRLLYISDSLMTLGAIMKPSSYDHASFWRQAIEIELNHDFGLKSSLSLKTFRLASSLMEDNDYDAAYQLVLKSVTILYTRTQGSSFLQTISGSSSSLDMILVKIKCNDPIFNAQFPNIPPDINLSITQHLLDKISLLTIENKSQIVSSLVDEVFSNEVAGPPDRLHAANIYFQTTGTLHPAIVAYYEDLQANPPEEDILHLLALTLLNITANSKLPTSVLVSNLKCIITMTQDSLTKGSPPSLADLDWILSFLELQACDDMKIDLIKTLISSYPKASPETLCTFHVQLSRAYLRMGFTGFAGQEAKRAVELAGSLHGLTKLEAVLCDFQCSVENIYLDQAQRAFEHACKLIGMDPVIKQNVINGRQPGETRENFQQRIILFARMSLTTSKFQLAAGQCELAASLIRQLVRFLLGFFKKMSSSQSLCYIWRLYSILIDAQLLAAKVHEKLGIAKETLYYLQEAGKIAKSCGSNLRCVSITSAEAEMHIKMGKIATGQNLLQASEEQMDNVKGRDLNFLNMAHSVTLCLQRQGNYTEELLYYDLCESIFEEAVRNQQAPIDQITEGVSQLTLQKKRANKDLKKLTGKISQRRDKQTAVRNGEFISLEIAHNALVRNKVFSLGLQIEIQKASSLLLVHLNRPSRLDRENVLFKLAESRNLYLRAQQLFAADPVLGVLQDSAISLPCVGPGNYSVESEAVNLLKRSRDLIYSILHNSNAIVSCTALEVNEINNLLISVIATLSALCQSTENACLETMLSQEKFRGLTLQNDRVLTKLRDYHKPGHWVQESRPGARVSEIVEQKMEIKNCLSLLDIVPNWLVVSISVCTETGDLVLTRFQASKTPFMLNLPVNRHSSRDADEQSFSFDNGLQQLRDIIEQSNNSADVSRTSQIATKEDRQKWWKERYDLDSALEGVLRDAEYCWLGGFRGVFDPSIPQTKEELAVKFRNSFTTVLNKYLPSRAKLKKAPVELDPMVLDLFLGLGDPESLSDPGLLEDLVYFVLDVLQFHGERNAYDEIDLDQMFVEIEELLQSYHSRKPVHNEDFHVILVVDKKTQAFPWESIPCLSKLSVSRVTSLQMLGELLENYGPSFTVDDKTSSNYHYILNPGGDLPKTQERFETLFKQDPKWKGTVDQRPSEDHMAEVLENSSLLVYMGHGGGEQYIRSGRVKALSRCCPTLLFGCSSGHLEDLGEYDPSGVPMSYMVSGCPMLVANLWDVTDKDIDKFSRSVLQKWGVIESDSKQQTVSIAQAVMSSREECNLKYLNGGAPVVYGIPLSI